MAIMVFNRYENKFLIDQSKFDTMQKELPRYMELDSYNQDGAFYTISNIYYDTEDDTLIRTSLGKPRYKEKLRLRAYGVPGPESLVYLEIKKKVNGLVNKRRTGLLLKEAYSFINEKQLPDKNTYVNEQVVRELAYFLSRYELIPKLYLAYDRIAYFEKGNSDLRISFDFNIRTRRDDLRLEAGDYGNKLIDEDWYIMEVKCKRAVPIWLCRLLSNNRIFPTGFSKYGTEYTKHLEQTRQKENEKCLISYSQHQRITQ